MKYSLLLSFYTQLQCICCVFGAHLNHRNNSHNIKSKLNFKFDNNFWFQNEISDTTPKPHLRTQYSVWNSYEMFRPDTEEPDVESSVQSSGSLPPYYLSYDSGQLTRYLPVEDKVDGPSEQQMAADASQYTNTESGSKIRTIDSYYDRTIRIESQLKDEDNSDNSDNFEQMEENTVKTIYNQNGERKVGRLGRDGTFGFYMTSRFYPCDKPGLLLPDPDNPGNYIIPNYSTYYRKCQYYEEDPRHKNQRKVGKLGKLGFFGYFEHGKFVVCDAPKQLDKDPNNPDLYYIPDGIEYDPKCQYYDQNLTLRFDYRTDSKNFAVKAIQTISFLTLLPILYTGFVVKFLI